MDAHEAPSPSATDNYQVNIEHLLLFQIDAALCDQSYVYASFRRKGSIGLMITHLVKPGTFAELRQFMIQNTSASAVQFKVPRVLKRKDAVNFMMNHVAS